MTLEACALGILDTLQKCEVPHMLVGGLSSNVYGIPRSTKDVDIVIRLESMEPLRRIEEALPPEFEIDPQVTFETITGNLRHIIRVRGTPFVIELFELAKNDSFQSCRFERRREVFVPPLNRIVLIPTAEDVVVQKLRWGRAKDIDDVRAVMAVQGRNLDHSYVQDWCRRLNILDRYESVRATVPDI
jgi:hypothetical protein